jgi:predicted nucleic acid-binding protein
MKALDTAVLLALLEGDRPAREFLRRLRGVELVTTEVNLLELSYLASRGGTRLRGRRRLTLGRLRRKVTVFPIDSRAIEESARRLARGLAAPTPLTEAMVGALAANGCEELYTAEGGLDLGKVPFKVIRIREKLLK